MTLTSLILTAVRAALILGVALAAMPLLRRASAATRRVVLVAAFCAVIIAPFVTALGPSLRVSLPATTASPVDSNIVPAPESIARPGLLASSSVSRTVDARVAESSAWALSPMQLALAVWALGALAVLARLANGLVRARLLARSGDLVATERSGSRVVQVRVSAAVETPAVTGIFAPVVLLPREALTWTEERLQVVRMHEFAHVAQGDVAAAIVAQVVCAMHWFNPLAWMAWRRLLVERELAADDRVLRGGARASSYAEHLLAIATAHADAYAVPLGALGMAQHSRSQIEERIRAVLSASRASAPLSRLQTAALATCATAILFAVACSTTGSAAPPTPLQASTADSKAVAASSTIDPALQAIADEETDRMELQWKARSAVVVVLDPNTGAVVAMTSRTPEADVEMAGKALVPGSTMKPFVVAAALDEGAIEERQTFDCEKGKRFYGNESIHDATPNAVLDAAGILASSSNVGAAKIFDELGGGKLVAWAKRFHFGERAPLQLRGMESGVVPQAIEDRSLLGARVAMGEAVTATPMQIAAAFAALANGGTYHAPTTVRSAIDGTGERVVKPETAASVMAMLEGAVAGDKGTGTRARIAGVRVAGKTGSAEVDASGETYASFVGAAPAGHPKYVVLVGAVARGGYGGAVAAPVFARIMTRALSL